MAPQALPDDTPAGGRVARIPGLDWEKEFGSPHYWDEASVLIAGQEASYLFVAGTSTSAANAGASPRYWIKAIGTHGAEVRGREFDRALSAVKLNPAYGYIRSGIVTTAGTVVLAAEEEDGDAVLVELDKAMKVTRRLEIKQDRVGGDLVLFQMTRVADGIMLMGRAGADAYIALVDNAWRQRWARRIDRKHSEAFLDAVPKKNGNVLLVGNISTFKSTFYPGPSEIWIVEMSPQGKILSESRSPGRYGRCATINGVDMFIVYDRSSTAAQDTHVMMIDDSLQLAWDAPVHASDYGFANMFHIGTGVNGRVIVAGTSGQELVVAEFDEYGTRAWQYHGMGRNRARRATDLVYFDGNFYMLTRNDNETSKRQPSYMYGIIRF